MQDLRTGCHLFTPSFWCFGSAAREVWDGFSAVLPLVTGLGGGEGGCFIMEGLSFPETERQRCPPQIPAVYL